jgi:hypothetical protein
MKMPMIVATLVLAVAAIGFGSLLHSLIPKAFLQFDRVVLTLLGGLVRLGRIFFSVGQVWFSRFAIVLVLFSEVILNLSPLAQLVRECRPALAKVRVLAPSAGIRVLSLLSKAVGGFALPSGVEEPFFIELGRADQQRCADLLGQGRMGTLKPLARKHFAEWDENWISRARPRYRDGS